MARQQRKKTRVHAVAARSKASSTLHKALKPEDALGAAAVTATFGDEPDGDAAPEADDETESVPVNMQRLSHGQRKRLKRRVAFIRKMGMVSRVSKKQQSLAQTQTSGAFADLEDLHSSLYQAVEDNNKCKSTGNKKRKALSGRQRQKLAVHELGQLKAVQTHSGFKSDPFAAIQNHLLYTVVQANKEVLDKHNAVKKKKRAGVTMDMDVQP